MRSTRARLVRRLRRIERQSLPLLHRGGHEHRAVCGVQSRGGAARTYQTYFANTDVQATFEGLHFFVDPAATGGSTALQQEQDALKAGYSAALDALQAVIDTPAGNPSPSTLTCSIVVTPINPAR